MIEQLVGFLMLAVFVVYGLGHAIRNMKTTPEPKTPEYGYLMTIIRRK